MSRARTGSPARALASAALALLACAGTSRAGETDLFLVGAGRASLVSGPPAWIEGGFGRLSEGGEPSGDARLAGSGQLQLGLDWRPSPVWLFRLHGLARLEPRATGGWRLGVAEAFLQWRPELSANRALRLRAGAFFPPTSRENVDPLWQSPYTLTLSALNSWIAEEVRPVGLDAALQLGRSPGGQLELAGALFGGADTAGALLAWRGWALHDRLSVVGEVLPLPPLTTLRPGGAFAKQRADGTRPVDEIDRHAGWQARARYSHGQAILLQAAWTDNGGDRRLYHGQYSWATRWASAGAEIGLPAGLRAVAEAALGDTGMGPRDREHVDVRLRTVYALLAWRSPGETFRASLRYDRFRNDDRDGVAEPDGDDGHAWTLAAFWRPRPWLRIGVEGLSSSSRRPAAAFSGASADTSARRLTAEVRLQR